MQQPGAAGGGGGVPPTAPQNLRPPASYPPPGTSPNLGTAPSPLSPPSHSAPSTPSSHVSHPTTIAAPSGAASSVSHPSLASPLSLPSSLMHLQQTSAASQSPATTPALTASSAFASSSSSSSYTPTPSSHMAPSASSSMASSTPSYSQPQTPTPTPMPSVAGSYRAAGMAPPQPHGLQHFVASLASGQSPSASTAMATSPPAPEPTELISKHKLSELLRHTSSHRIEPEVEDVLLELADDFLENLIAAGSLLAKHRGADTLEVRDVALHMERTWDMRLPGYSHHLESLDMRGKRLGLSEIHKKRIALIKKTNELAEKENKKKNAAKRKRKEGDAS